MSLGINRSPSKSSSQFSGGEDIKRDKGRGIFSLKDAEGRNGEELDSKMGVWGRDSSRGNLSIKS